MLALGFPLRVDPPYRDLTPRTGHVGVGLTDPRPATVTLALAESCAFVAGVAGTLLTMSSPYGPKDPTPSPDQQAEPQAESPQVIVPVEQPEPADPGAATAAADEPAQQYYRPSVPGQNQMIMKPTSKVHAGIRGGLAGLFAIAAVVNQFWGFRFPGNAPVEQIFVFGITLDLVAMAVVLGIFAILAASRRSVPVKPQSVSPMAIAAIILSGVTTVFWLLGCLIPVLMSVASGERYQYMTAVGAIFFLGVPWVLGTIFGTLSLRSGGRLTPILATVSIGLGVILAIGAVTFSVIYGLGLSN